MTTIESMVNAAPDAAASTPCPSPRLVLSGNLTGAERAHVVACPQCQDRVFRLYEESESPARRALRHFRLLLLDWNPVLQFCTLLSVLAFAGWAGYRIRSLTPPSHQASSTAIQEGHPYPLTQVRQQVPQSNFQDEILAELSKQVAWPWNTCGIAPEKVNIWLGQGKQRQEIDRRLRSIKASIRSQRRLREAEQHWCGSLSMGSPAISKSLRQVALGVSSTAPPSKRPR